MESCIWSDVQCEEAVEVVRGRLRPGVAARPVAPARLEARLHLPHAHALCRHVHRPASSRSTMIVGASG
jgi:hypothetical protein